MEDEQPKIIPAFYCCYLLRSKGIGYKTSALYIGSTPDPARRLAQHNGLSKGGACRTADEKRRPWEMTMLVEGFTSRVAALQFEWAWQHPAATRHLTKDIPDNNDSKFEGDAEEDAVTDKAQQKPKARKKSKPQEKTIDDHIKKKAKKRKPPARRKSLKAHLEDLHLLLRSTYFGDWPLTLRFFAADVLQAWRLWCDRVDGIIPDHITAIPDGDCADFPAQRARQYLKVGTVQGIKSDYTPIKDYLEKAMSLLDKVGSLHCRICEARYQENDSIVVCPHPRCNCTTHLLCLLTRFLEATKDLDRFVPLSGECPACNQTVQWPLMMRELSIRTRGKEMLNDMIRKCERKNRQLVKKVEAKETMAEKPKAVAGGTQDEEGHDTDSLDDYWDKILESDSESGTNYHPQHDSTASKVEVVIEDTDEELG
ncbi:structure-specific endonuclease subunit slx1 [Aspergillus spectabilis]